MPWHEGRSACCHAPTEWIAVVALLSLACPSRATGSLTCSVRGVLSFSACVSYACVVTITPLTPAERRVGRTARMTMPFGYVANGRLCKRFATRHAHAPLGWWRVWSARLVVTRRNSFPLRPSSRAGNPPHRAHVPREGHCVDPALNEQATTKVRTRVCHPLHARAPLGSLRVPVEM
jgi:hypothetical protein